MVRVTSEVSVNTSFQNAAAKSVRPDAEPSAGKDNFATLVDSNTSASNDSRRQDNAPRRSDDTHGTSIEIPLDRQEEGEPDFDHPCVICSKQEEASPPIRLTIRIGVDVILALHRLDPLVEGDGVQLFGPDRPGRFGAVGARHDAAELDDPAHQGDDEHRSEGDQGPA